MRDEARARVSNDEVNPRHSRISFEHPQRRLRQHRPGCSGDTYNDRLVFRLSHGLHGKIKSRQRLARKSRNAQAWWWIGLPYTD